MLVAELQPAQLIVLQAVARAFDFDHPVGFVLWPELNQVGHPGAVSLDVEQQTIEPMLEVCGGQAGQCLLQQVFIQRAQNTNGDCTPHFSTNRPRMVST